MSSWLVLFIKQKRNLVVIRNEVAWFRYKKKKPLDRWYLIRKSNISNDFVILKETYARTKRAYCVKFSTHIYIKSTVVWFFLYENNTYPGGIVEWCASVYDSAETVNTTNQPAHGTKNCENRNICVPI